MKYSGTITVLDDQGESVFERELTADEIIDCILEEKKNTEEEAAPVIPQKRKYKKREGGVAEKKEKPAKHTGVRHPCCGSNGPRHLKSCTAYQERGTSKNARMVSDRKGIFSNGTWSSVKNALDGGDSPGMIMREKGLDEDEIRRVNLSDSYEEYLKIA